ncbi:MAG: 50S ribosomal protein L1 [Armatimonadetes bacterium]|nr:50S ribosomal protein L1 [Armatimonadota bacterium]MCX7967047.1 50S ribosomal protein L1 [Armatimonadota bacterium]MDW8142539.1 50S ribosomal protein L1 [Armatimonadota bacterium]
MAKRGKRYRQLLEVYDKQQVYSVSEALDLVKKLATAKFDESVDVAIVLGVDPRKSDQRVRGVVQLPYGTGKQPVVAVIAKGEKVREAEEAGADYVGAEDLIDRIDKGWKDFDYLIATPDMMRLISRLGRKLGPLMPSPRNGTVTNEVGEVVRQLKSGRLDFRTDQQGVVHAVIGKVSFPVEHLLENFKTLLDALLKSRPATQRGQYIKSIAISPTMGPSVKVDVQKALQLVR